MSQVQTTLKFKSDKVFVQNLPPACYSHFQLFPNTSESRFTVHSMYQLLATTSSIEICAYEGKYIFMKEALKSI